MSNPLPSTADGPAAANLTARRVFVGVCRFAVAGLFLFAAITKIVDLAGFEERLLLRSPLPASAATAVARILPWLELTLAFCLLLGRAVREAAALAALLLAAFLVYTAFFATNADCGCLLFPITENAPPRSWLLVRDGLAFAAAIVTACTRRVTEDTEYDRKALRGS